MTRILTWNIGSFVFLKFGKYLEYPPKASHEYFHPEINAKLVSDSLSKIDPDFLFLQEFWNPSDAKNIEYLKEYPYQQYLDMWYRKESTLIASKKPFSVEMMEGFPLVMWGGLKMVPIHLNSYSSEKRLVETKFLFIFKRCAVVCNFKRCTH